MKVTGLNQGMEFLNKLNNRQKDATKTNDVKGSEKFKDKLEISDDAKILMNNEVSKKDLAAIRERINNNYYNSDKVLDQVASKILKDIKG